MQETEIAHPADPFQQGDIVQLIDSDEKNSDPTFGIIVNADCDLAHCKIDGVVSYLPLFSFDFYFQQFWIPSFIAEREIELLDSIAQTCGLEREQINGLRSWVNEEDTSQIISKLSTAYSVREGTIRPKIVELHAIIKSTDYNLELLMRLIEIQGQKKDEAISKYARRALRTLGEGHFFINEIVGVPSVGFVARMRRTYSINSELVYPSISQFRLSVDKTPTNIFAIRIAKLTNLYRFKVAQLFAYQFSRIGLPDEITALNEVAVQAAVLNLGDDNG